MRGRRPTGNTLSLTMSTDLEEVEQQIKLKRPKTIPDGMVLFMVLGVEYINVVYKDLNCMYEQKW